MSPEHRDVELIAAYAAGVGAERERIAAIFGLPDARGLELAALKLAFATPALSIEQVQGILAIAAAEQAKTASTMH